MKNILVLNYEFPPLGWGQANANYYLFKEFRKYNDYKFTLITSSVGKKKIDEFSDNITIYYLDIWKNWKNLHNQWIKDLLVNAYKTYKLSKKIIQKEKIDLTICWSYPAIGIWYRLFKRYNIPYIALLRGSDVPFYEKKWEFLDKFIFKYLAPIFWKNAKYVIANSKQLKELALNISPKQDIKVITNWINLEEFKSKNNDKKNNKKFNILFVWRLTERKWITYLLEWFKNFSKDKMDVYLNIVWDGSLYEEVKSYIEKNNLKDNVKLHWLVNHKNIKEFYHVSDMYILPSLNEWMSNTLLEAMASSLPVVITEVWWTKELFDGNGWIIKKKDSDDITEKLELAYQYWKQWKLNMLWEKSYEIVSNMSWENKAKEFINYIKKIW